MKDGNLTILSARPASGDRDDRAPAVPRPGFNWKTRLLVPAVVLGGFFLLLGMTGFEELVPRRAVEVSPVILKSLDGKSSTAVTVQAAGWVEAYPYKSFVTALTNGIVREVLVLEGETVEQGQVVARLVDEDAKLAVDRARARVRELEAALAEAEAERKAAKTDWENPIDRRQAVQVAKALLAESRANHKQISSEIEMEEADLEHIKSQFERGETLHGSGAMSEQEFVRLRSEYTAQKARIAALRNRLAATKELIIRREAELRAAKEHMELRTAERLRVERAEAATAKAEAALRSAKTALAEAELRLKRMEIKSPLSGVVMSRLTEPGSKVVVMSDNPLSAKVLSLYDPKRLQVRVDVPLADAAEVSVGQEAEVVVEVLPDKTFSGTVTRVLHEADIQKNTLEVKVSVDDPDPKLRPEMLARVKFLAKREPADEEHSRRVFVPKGAIHGTGSNAVAWVVRDFNGEQATVSRRSISPGRTESEGWTDVLEGLHPGDLVVTGSVSGLADGDPVNVLLQ